MFPSSQQVELVVVALAQVKESLPSVQHLDNTDRGSKNEHACVSTARSSTHCSDVVHPLPYITQPERVSVCHAKNDISYSESIFFSDDKYTATGRVLTAESLQQRFFFVLYEGDGSLRSFTSFTRKRGVHHENTCQTHHQTIVLARFAGHRPNVRFTK